MVSATVTQNLRNVIVPYLLQPIEVVVEDIERINSSLDYSFYWCEENQKIKKLTQLMTNSLQGNSHSILFPMVILCQTRLEVVSVNAMLKSFSNISWASVTMETTFQERRELINRFQEGEMKILVATPGIVGRGIELRSAHSVRRILLVMSRLYYGHVLLQ